MPFLSYVLTSGTRQASMWEKIFTDWTNPVEGDDVPDVIQFQTMLHSISYRVMYIQVTRAVGIDVPELTEKAPVWI